MKSNEKLASSKYIEGLKEDEVLLEDDDQYEARQMKVKNQESLAKKAVAYLESQPEINQTLPGFIQNYQNLITNQNVRFAEANEDFDEKIG